MPGRRLGLQAGNATAVARPARTVLTGKLGVYLGGIANAARLPTYDTWLGKATSFVLDFCSGGDGFQLMPETWLTDPYIGSGKNLVVSIPKPDAVTLASIAAGTEDAHIATMVSNCQTAGVTWTRPMWEFNGSWEPWYAGTDPTTFINAWRKLAAPLIAGGINVIWAPSRGLPSSSWHWSNGWPGDAYVTHVGCDVYDENSPAITDAASRWDTIYNGSGGVKELMDHAKIHSKRFCVTEWGMEYRAADPTAGGDNILFINNMLDIVLRDSNTVMGIYFDTEETDGHHSLSNVTITNSGTDNTTEFPLAAPAYRQGVA